MRLLIAVTAWSLLSGTSGGRLHAAGHETFEPGTGKYILVLKQPPSEKNDPVTGKPKSNEPDVAKHGGKVLHKKDLVRVVKLPTAAAKLLRKEENVEYVQRVWVGESREAWADGEEEPTSVRTDRDFEALDADLPWTTGQYAYDGSGNVKQIGADVYRYDTAGRLIKAVVKNTTETYQYDAFGNLVARTTGGVVHAAPVNASNRLTGESYDLAGNVVTREAEPSYTFDSVSMMSSHYRYPTTHRMIYGPDDERIGVVQEGTLSRWKIRGFDGKVLREYRSDDLGIVGLWYWMKDYVYADGRVVGTERMPHLGGKRHFHTDQIGNVRMITDQNKFRVSVHDYFPFGVEKTDITQEYNNSPVMGGSGGDYAADPIKFTGHERDFRGWLNVDNDDYLDYMHARYYDPHLARFLSVDPVLGDPAVPQSWNRYEYARNSPLVYTDPTGEVIDVTDLTPEERQQLIDGLNEFTGNTYEVDKNNHVVLVSVGADSSPTATTFMNQLIGSPKVHKVVATSGGSEYDLKRDLIKLNFNSFKGADYNGLDPRTFNLGSTAIHEWTHQVSCLEDTLDGNPSSPQPDAVGWTGPVVEAVNVMRAERGFATRESHRATEVNPPGFRGFFGIGPKRTAIRFFDPHRGRIVQVIRNHAP